MNPVKRPREIYRPPGQRSEENSVDPNSPASQRQTWESLKKGINGCVNKVTRTNLEAISRELFRWDLVRGRGLFCRAVMQSVNVSNTVADVVAALVAVANSIYPTIGNLLLRRLLSSFQKAYKRNQKASLFSIVALLSHLTLQHVVDELILYEILVLLLNGSPPSSDGIEVAVSIVKIMHRYFSQNSPRSYQIVTQGLRLLLNEASLPHRCRTLLEDMFASMQAMSRDTASDILPPELDVIDASKQHTHDDVSLDDPNLNTEDTLDFFKALPPEQYAEQRESHTHQLMLLGISESDVGGGGGDDDDDDQMPSENDDDDEPSNNNQTIPEAGPTVQEALAAVQTADTEERLRLRKELALIVQGSNQADEVAHKILRTVKTGSHEAVSEFIIELCWQPIAYQRYHGAIATRLCQAHARYQDCFEELFTHHYLNSVGDMTSKELRHTAKLFAQLLQADAIGFHVFECVHLTLETSTSEQRAFLGYVFEDLHQLLGAPTLLERLTDQSVKGKVQGLFPQDSVVNVRNAIKFYEAVKLPELCGELRKAYNLLRAREVEKAMKK